MLHVKLPLSGDLWSQSGRKLLHMLPLAPRPLDCPLWEKHLRSFHWDRGRSRKILWTQDFPSTIPLLILSLGPTDEIPFICSVMNVTKIGCRGIIFPSPSSGCSASKGRRCNATERSLTHLCVRRRYTSVLCADVARKSAANRLT